MSVPTQPAPRLATDVAPGANALLARLAKEAQQPVLAHATRVALARHDVLAAAGEPPKWAYFLCSGLVSVQTIMEDAASVEVALLGREGIVCPQLMPGADTAVTSVVIVAGEAWRLRADALQAECERSAPLQRVLLQYSHALVAEMFQRSACLTFHTARQRLAKWLLTVSDRTHSARIDMTQDRLGQVLGLQRTGVNAASIALQDLGVIKARHGHITILDRRRMQEVACECGRGQ